MDYQKLRIKDFGRWSLFLHEKQQYLGRVYLHAEWEGAEGLDFWDMGFADYVDVRTHARKVKKALKNLFQPDRFNTLSLGNVYDHLHVQIVPRYKAPRHFDGIEFTDENWGKNYKPYDESFLVPGSTLFRIRDSIRDELGKPHFNPEGFR